MNDCLCCRVAEFQTASMQCNSSQTMILVLLSEGDRRAVLKIAQQGMAPRGGLHANLMGAARFPTGFPAMSPNRPLPTCDSATWPTGLPHVRRARLPRGLRREFYEDNLPKCRPRASLDRKRMPNTSFSPSGPRTARTIFGWRDISCKKPSPPKQAGRADEARPSRYLSVPGLRADANGSESALPYCLFPAELASAGRGVLGLPSMGLLHVKYANRHSCLHYIDFYCILPGGGVGSVFC